MESTKERKRRVLMKTVTCAVPQAAAAEAAVREVEMEDAVNPGVLQVVREAGPEVLLLHHKPPYT